MAFERLREVDGTLSAANDVAMYELRYPVPDLQPFIENYWFVRNEPDDPVDITVNVFVDARADLIFNFGVPYQRTIIGGSTHSLSASNLDGQRTQPIRIEQRGAVDAVGVRFRLGGLAPFARVDVCEVRDATVAPALVFGDAVMALEQALRVDSDVDAQAGALDAYFLETAESVPTAFWDALETIERTHGSTSIADVAAGVGVSVRQVERLFRRHLGLTPKMLCRVQRFQTALRRLMTDPDGTLADVAQDAGYFDQAHFVKDFRDMTGGVPRGYRGYYPEQGPHDFAPNVVVFLQEEPD